MQAQKALLRHLQKTFKVSSQLCSNINVKMKESTKYLDTLSNIEEQYVCCKRVNFTNSPYKEFPSLKENLTYKLVVAIEEELEKLKVIVSDLATANDKIQKQTDALFALYHRYSEQLSVDDLTEGEPTRPSICMMMEYAQRIQQYFYVEYCRKKHTIQHVNYDNPATVTQLVHEWGSLEGISQINSNVLPWIQFFMTEEI